MNDPRNSRRRAAAILLLIAVFSLLLTLAFIVPRPDTLATPAAISVTAASPVAGDWPRSASSLQYHLPLVSTHWTTWAKGAGTLPSPA